MTYETKNITFHMIRVKVSSDSQCSITLPMNKITSNKVYQLVLSNSWVKQQQKKNPRNIHLSKEKKMFYLFQWSSDPNQTPFSPEKKDRKEESKREQKNLTNTLEE